LTKPTSLFFRTGSPFQYSVGQLSSGGTHKVQVGGPGVERGEVGASSEYMNTFRILLQVFN